MISEDLLDVLERTWRAVAHEYDVSAELPDMQTLFDGADLVEPCRAAEIVMANMLMEVMESVGRFSAWYTVPGRAFGLLALRDRATNRLQRMLAPEAVKHWAALLGPLAAAIQKNVGLILATQVVDDLIGQSHEPDPCVMARCGCVPPHLILTTRSSLTGAGVICERCHSAFHECQEIA